MPAKEVSMNKFKIILRLHHESKLSQHQIAKSLKLSVGVVNKYLQRAKAASLSWPLSSELEDEGLLKQLIKPVPLNLTHSSAVTIDFPRLHQEMKRKGVTQQLLWEEEIKAGTLSISYSQFSLRYRKWKAVQPKSMRQVHRAGDKVFVDYAGPTMDIIDPKTGEIIPVQIFVGVLGASNYTFAEATRSQGLADWIGSHQRMFEFFGGVPALVVPDNLRSAVTKSCRYEPDINKTYADFIDYYGTAVLPARPYKPKDKAKAENAVLIVERWIMARLRHQTFVGLAALNQAIRVLLAELNQRPFKKLPGCRQLCFATYDKPALRPLPQYPYQYMEIKKARVHVDYHIELLGHYYSVPYAFIKKEIDLGNGIDFYRVVEEFENRLISEALRRTNHNKNRAAQLLSMNRTTLVEKLKKRVGNHNMKNDNGKIKRNSAFTIFDGLGDDGSEFDALDYISISNDEIP